MVARKDHDSVVGQRKLVKLREQPTDPEVKPIDRSKVPPQPVDGVLERLGALAELAVDFRAQQRPVNLEVSVPVCQEVGRPDRVVRHVAPYLEEEGSAHRGAELKHRQSMVDGRAVLCSRCPALACPIISRRLVPVRIVAFHRNLRHDFNAVSTVTP